MYPPQDCIPDESIYTVEEFNTLKKQILTEAAGIREIQHADKRTVYRSMTENQQLLATMADAIWGHCPNYQNGPGRRRYVISSKGIC